MRRFLPIAPLAALAILYALPMMSVGCAQTAHYAATRSFAVGRPDIDPYKGESCDIVRTNGHYYAAKGPLMDLWTAPWFRALHVLGAVPANPQEGKPYPAAMLGTPLRALWQMGIWAVVVPAFLLLLLVRRVAERIEPGLGTAAAVGLGLCTLVLPFSTMLFAHVPAALLAFAAFALLLEGRSPALAGTAAGLAVSADIPLAVPAVLIGLYACARAPRLRRLVEFGTGGVVGLLPLLAFNEWAFRSPFHLPYSGVALDPGAGGVEQAAGSGGFFGLELPSLRIAMHLLFSQRGLLVLTPVVGAGFAGLVLLWRRGLRAEATLIAALCVVEIAWNSGRINPDYAIGGWVPGPRFLIPLLPFLFVAAAPALRAAPGAVAALAAVSAAAMLVATSAEPLLPNSDTHSWVARIADGNFAQTIVSLAGVGHGWLAILPFYAVAAIVVGATVAATRLPMTRTQMLRGAVALAAWLVVLRAAPRLLDMDDAVNQSTGLLAVIVVAAVATLTVVRPPTRRTLLAVPLLALLVPSVAHHTKWALLLGVLVLLAVAAPVPGRLRALEVR